MYQIKTVSIIVPIYNEEGNILNLAKEITSAMIDTTHKYEVLFVNDGSVDKSWELIEKASTIYPNCRGVDLAGNYGQTIAIRAGLNQSWGDVIVAMDGDMQHNPAYIPKFLKYIEEGYDLVGGSKEKRPESSFKAALANIAHKVICKISGVKMKYFGATFKVYRRYLFDNVNLIGDAHRFLGALVARKGIKFIEMPIEIRERGAGKSNYKFSKVFMVIVDLLLLKFSVSYINKPFRLFGIIGLSLMIIGLSLLLYFLIGNTFFNWAIGKNHQIEFISSIFMVLTALLLLSIGIVAQIGTQNNFSGNGKEPYSVRQTAKLGNKGEAVSV